MMMPVPFNLHNRAQRPGLRLITREMMHLPPRLRNILGSSKFAELNEALSDVRSVFCHANLINEGIPGDSLAVDFTRIRAGDITKGGTRIGHKENPGQFQLFKLMVAMMATSMEIIVPVFWSGSGYNVQGVRE